MTYLKDPRRRITLNFHPDDHAALAADATRAGHESAYAYVMALVRARGAAPRPVLDENGQLRVARMQGKLTTLREQLAAAEARAGALSARLLAAQRELDQRPTSAQVQLAIKEGLKAQSPEAGPPAEGPAPALLTPEEKAEARRRRVRQRQREAGRTTS